MTKKLILILIQTFKCCENNEKATARLMSEILTTPALPSKIPLSLVSTFAASLPVVQLIEYASSADPNIWINMQGNDLLYLLGNLAVFLSPQVRELYADTLMVILRSDAYAGLG